MFFGESMFSAESGGSEGRSPRSALRLREWGWPLIDAQVGNPHLDTLGAEAWPRPRFLAAVVEACAQPGRPGSWAGRSRRCRPRRRPRVLPAVRRVA